MRRTPPLAMAASAAAALLAIGLPGQAASATVHSGYSLVSGNTWQAEFRLVNDGQPAQIGGFTLYFPETVFSHLSLLAAPAAWDTLLIPPDLALPGAGFLDSAVLNSADALVQGDSLGGWRVQFELLSGATPPALAFDINDAAYNVLFSGTTVLNAVPEPATLLLALLGLGAAASAGAMRAQPHRQTRLEHAA